MIRVLYTILFFCVFLSVQSYGQTDREFWFVAPEVTSTHVDRPIYLRISAGAVAATVTIQQPANAPSFNSGSPMVISVAANTTFSQDLTPWITQLENGEPTANIVENKGLYITSDQDITAYYEVLGTTGGGVVQNSEIFSLKGANALGTTFYTPFQNLLDNANNIYCTPCITGHSSFDIVATTDNTTITITPTQNIVGHAAGVPFTIVLNRGQTYSGLASGTLAAEHLSGTLITSDKPIAVTIKDDSIRQNYALDLIGDQLVPVTVLGTDYIVVKGALNRNNDPGLFGNSDPNPSFGDRAIICATQNGTTVTIGGVLKTTLAAGQTYNYQVTLAAEYISLSHPAYVFHLSGFGDEVGGALLPPIVCTGSRQVSIFRDTNEPFYINILVKNGGQGNFSLKNSLTGITSSIPSGSFTVVPNTPVAGDWYAASILYNTTDFPAGSSGLVTNSTNDFHCGIINGEATGAGARYGYFSDYASVTGGSASANSTPICFNSTATLNVSGSAGNIQWQKSADGVGGWANVVGGSGATTVSYTTPAQTVTAYYRAVLTKGTCVSAYSTVATVTVNPLTVVGSVTSDATVCSGTNSGTLTLAGHTGSVVRWESSTTNFVTSTAIANVTTSQTYTNITATTKYRAVVQSGVCSSGNSTSATITIDPVSVGGTVSSSATVCSGSNTGTLTLAGHTGNVIRWESSTNNFVATTSIANVTTSLTYTNIVATTKYRAVVQSGTCAAVNSSNVTITVDPVSVGGTVSSSATVCSGSNTGTLTLAGHTGSIVRWESSTDNFVTTTSIANVTTSQTYTNVATTTKYRAVVQSGTCAAATSASATITVDAPTVAGTVSSSATVCSGSNSGTLTLAGHTGSVVRWESSTDNFVTTTSIVNATASQTYTNIAATTKYRAVVQSGTCAAANSTSVTITIDAPTVAGTVSSDATVCSGSNSATLTLAGHTGSIVRWESSTDNFTSTTSIANVTTSQSYTNIAATTKYRAVVKSGTCSSVNSAAATITVDPVTVAGTVSSDATVCSGSNSGTLTLAGNTGSIVRWESSTDNFVTTTSIANVTASQTYTNILATTKYRAVVKSGTCSSANSTNAIITVDAPTVAGTVSSNATVCSGSNSGTLTLAGNTGSIVRWESSTDNFATITSIANVTASQTYTNIAAATKYRAVVKSGTCSSANSASATISIDAPTVAGTVSSDATVCSGSNSGTLTLAGYTGSIVRWESSTNNFVATTTIANVTASQTYTNIAATTKYRAVVKSGTCSSANSSNATITVDPVTVAGTVSASATVCSGTNSGTLTLAGHTGNVLRWESSTDNFATATTIANVTTSQTYTNLVTATKYRAVVQSGTCAAANSASATISLDVPTVAGSVTSDATVCAGGNSSTLTLAGHTGSIVRWESSTDNFVTSANIVNTTTTQNYLNLLATTKYRAVVQSGTCSAVNSTSATITIGNITVGGTVSSDATVCSGSNSGTLTLAGHTGNVLQWESSVDNFVTPVVIANITTSQNYLNLVASTKYRALVQSGTCTSAYSSEVEITVGAVSDGGMVSSDTSVCMGANAGTLTLVSYSGNILNWESSTDNFVSTTNIANITATQAYNNLAVATKYRAVVQSGICAPANSVEASIIIDAPTVAGTLSADATVCSGSNAGTLTIAGNTGSILRWESSTDNFATINSIANITSSQNYNNLIAATKYRVLVQSGTCSSATTNEVTISTDAPTLAGTINSDATVCAGANSGTLTLSGYTGSILRWESSTDNFVSSTNIANVSDTQNYLNVMSATKYRAVVQSGTCAVANSTSATISTDVPTVGGTINSDTTVCSGAHSATLNLIGYTGTIDHWESSTDNFATINSIANITASQSYTNLTSTTKYRAVLTSGVCASANSADATISIDVPTVAGTVTSDSTVCSGSNSGTLTLSGYTGSIVNWESSTDDFVSTTTIVNNTASQSYNNINSATKYRAIIKSGTCPAANSTAALISTDLPTVTGVLSSDTTVCSGANSGILNLVGSTGSIVRWESSTDNFATVTNIANVTSSYSYTNNTATTKYRVVIQSGTCSAINSNSATVTIDASTLGGSVGTSATVCYFSNSGTLNLSGQRGTILSWESSTDNFATSTNIVNTNPTYIFSGLLATTKFRAIIKSGVCPIANSVAAMITVDVPSVGGSINSDTTICAGVNSGTLHLTGNTGTILRWENSNDDFTTVNIITNTTSTQSYSNLTSSTKYRAVVKSGACTFTKSSAAKIKVDSISDGGNVSSDVTVCLGSNSGTLTLSGNTGSVLYWEQSTDNFATASPIPNITNTLVYNDISTPTKYRAVVKSGTCNAANSDSAVISIYPLSKGGQISSSVHGCFGNNSGTLTLQNYTGTVQSWEISEDNFVTKNTLSNTTISQPYSNLVNTTYYRAIVKSGTCPQDKSSLATITIDPTTLPGKVISSTTVCPGNNAGTLGLILYSGSILNWESSTDNFVTSTIIPNTSIIQAYSNLNDTTWYRASIKSGVCAQDYSLPAKITVTPHALGGDILSDTVVCYGKNFGTLSLKNQRGDLLYWESTTDNFVKTTQLLVYTTTKNYVNLTETTKYRAVIRFGNCPEEKSQPVTVEVDPLFSIDLGADTTICFKKGEWLGNVSTSFASVLWSDQSTAYSISVKQAGTVWVKVTDAASCSAQDTVNIDAFCQQINICFPDVITPNTDGLNDYFKPCVEIGGVRSEGSDEILNENVSFKKFEVHDRWGIKVFESSDKIPKWNGDNLANSVSAGTYFYYVTFNDLSGVAYEQTGYVTVIK
jgi:hypothetical protein